MYFDWSYHTLTINFKQYPIEKNTNSFIIHNTTKKMMLTDVELLLTLSTTLHIIFKFIFNT